MANEARSAELAIIISYPTSASGIIVLLKTPPKYRKRHFCRSWYNGSYTMMAKPMKSLELHYPMIQFLITVLIHSYIGPGRTRANFICISNKSVNK